jgi:ferric-dicitrate binding protein FerR (iron transport regulator)
MRVTTGASFKGARLSLVTPEAAIEVTGTTLAVICEPTGTCVCVHEGVVRVGPRGGDMLAVPAGRRRYIFNDGRAPELAEIRPVEHVELDAFQARYHSP